MKLTKMHDPITGEFLCFYSDPYQESDLILENINGVVVSYTKKSADNSSDNNNLSDELSALCYLLAKCQSEVETEVTI